MSTIYLLDDHAMMRDGLRAVLQANGHTVVGESGDPAEALTALERLVPDVLVLDLRLDDYSGLDLLRNLKRLGLPTRTIMLTMSAQAGHVSEALQLGALGYVLKGAPSSELLKAIRNVMQGRRYLGGDVADLVLQGLAGEAGASGVESLSRRERQVIDLVVRGKSSTEIGVLLHLSPKTVDTYRSRLMTKLGVHDVTALVRLAIREGLIPPDEV